jgi:hypothetical protein
MMLVVCRGRGQSLSHLVDECKLHNVATESVRRSRDSAFAIVYICDIETITYYSSLARSFTLNTSVHSYRDLAVGAELDTFMLLFAIRHVIENKTINCINMLTVFWAAAYIIIQPIEKLQIS